ncbi:anthranilate synthase component I [Gordonia hirsuta DSM 44140 = NBRC 16056]|uniref:Anthranilate synthase component I n=1 Tax=Gordonia hirsuta DSM 44140 = NBRC 16056 TaxID=1121927 RepID=L7LBL1_9ACTN|nr:aminodeoxychorismate synthase component I [Gordonia hirsuta]GAC57428.1 anthranilate synthase component I [Gordonia hirsuta DSM 44140 = NBRC 16056]
MPPSFSALDLFRALTVRTAADSRPGPAALIGDWCGADAVLAPSILIEEGLGPPDRPDRFWLGYLGFPVRADQAPLPETAGGLTDGILVLTGRTWSWRSATGAGCPAWVREVLDDAVPAEAAAHRAWTATWASPQREPHLAAIGACRDAIAAGDVYQACICTRFTGTLTGDPHHYFADLAATTTPAKAAFLQGDWGAVASLSPETFLRRRIEEPSIVTSSPIKGTVPRDVDPAVLAQSAKDIAENVMIVDLVRNDLGRVARTGSVTVPELLTVVGAPGVWHLVSTVRAELDPAVGNKSLLAATFPPASVTGTPKIRAAQLIAEWEQFPRGVYCGAIGLAGPGGELDLNVAIRTVQVSPDGAMTLGVGGGITYDSVPAAEWQECLDKAASIVSR